MNMKITLPWTWVIHPCVSLNIVVYHLNSIVTIIHNYYNTCNISTQTDFSQREGYIKLNKNMN